MLFICVMCMLFLFLAPYTSAEDCKECHFIPGDISHRLHSSPNIINPEYGNSGYTYQYSKNSNEYGFNCGNCHPQDISRHKNGFLDTELYSKKASGLKKMNSKDASFDTIKRTCSGVYCHSSGENRKSLKYIETPAWESSFGEFKCQGCHGSPPSYPNEKGRENSHFNTENGSGHLLGIHWDSTKGHTKESIMQDRSSDMGCSTCHYSTITKDTDTTFVDNVSGLFTCSRCHDDKSVTGKNRTGTIANKALHVNGIVEVAFSTKKFRSTARMIRVPLGWKRTGQKMDATGYDELISGLNLATYIPEEKKCLNVACHLTGKEVKWGDEIGCDSCHGDFLP
ncbi:MAG: hypothetical protein A2X59_10200 [Nitrospirae bacterium GWC2_42_7]|nr:MAG: hypothetical protein A2X59_10200 [Nitrospirae bacterium GWC2_42_7]